jgi:hypothetical protein
MGGIILPELLGDLPEKPGTFQNLDVRGCLVSPGNAMIHKFNAYIVLLNSQHNSIAGEGHSQHYQDRGHCC